MKKIVLLVASFFAIIQNFANRNIEGTDNNLILSQSDRAYNHGSHSSHSSHASHYSMMKHDSMIITATVAVKTDSVGNVSHEDRKSISHSIALMNNCDDNKIDIENIYVSNNNEIIIRGIDVPSYKPNQKERCLYINCYYKWDSGQRTHINYIIPISNAVETYYHVVGPHSCVVKKKEKWMVDIVNKIK